MSGRGCNMSEIAVKGETTTKRRGRMKQPAHETLSEVQLNNLYHPAVPGNFDHEAPVWSEVLPGLWQGGTLDRDVIGKAKEASITADNFDTVITMYQYANPVDWFVREVRYCIYDLNVDHFPVEELFDVVKIAHADWKRGKRVLIRCQAGLNRSGLVMALVLIREGFSAFEAIEMQRQARGNYVLFNKKFIEFLLSINPEDWQGDIYATTKKAA